MGIYSNIEHIIFGDRDEAPTLEQETPPPVIASGALAPAAGMAAPLESPPLVPLYGGIDVEAILDLHADAHAGRLDWRHSVADLLKTCGLPATAASRHDLAQDLGCDIDADDTVILDVLMRRLEDDGAVVPRL